MAKHTKSLICKPAGYYQASRQEMIKYIPKNVEKTLELGCGYGNFSALIKARFGAECWGVEINRQAAEIAATKLDKTINADVNQCLGDIPESYFDCVICNHFLEHLVDPYTLLIDLKKKLTSEGLLVAAVPNVRYCRNLYELVVRGNWDYKDKGILDKTHLRFFTYNSLVKIFPELGYELLTIEGLEPKHSLPSRIVKILNLLLLNKFEDTRFSELACVAKPVS